MRPMNSIENKHVFGLGVLPNLRVLCFLGPRALFTSLKIILLQYFQQQIFNFQQISGIQTHHIT